MTPVERVRDTGAFDADLPRDSFMNENFDDSYDRYEQYKDKPAGDSYV